MQHIGLTLDVALPLAFAFAVVATAYSAAGFGGGSTYSALLAQAGMSSSAIPLLSLPCNTLVSGAGFIRFLKRGYVPAKQLALVAAVSMPAAFFGGFIPVTSEVFFSVLGSILLVAGLSGLTHLLRARAWHAELTTGALQSPASSVRPLTAPAELPIGTAALLGLGTAIGFLSGIAGIGGGILLSPALLSRRDANPHIVAAMASGFIFLNSAAGLAGQVLKGGLPAIESMASIGFLLGAVFLGGFVGTSFALGRGRELMIRGATHLLVALVGGRLVLLF